MKDLLTPKEAAAMLGFRCTDSLARHDDLLCPTRTLGGQRRYERATVEAVRDGKRKKPAKPQPSAQERLTALWREAGLL